MRHYALGLNNPKLGAEKSLMFHSWILAPIVVLTILQVRPTSVSRYFFPVRVTFQTQHCSLFLMIGLERFQTCIDVCDLFQTLRATEDSRRNVNIRTIARLFVNLLPTCIFDGQVYNL